MCVHVEINQRKSKRYSRHIDFYIPGQSEEFDPLVGGLVLRDVMDTALGPAVCRASSISEQFKVFIFKADCLWMEAELFPHGSASLSLSLCISEILPQQIFMEFHIYFTNFQLKCDVPSSEVGILEGMQTSFSYEKKW